MSGELTYKAATGELLYKAATGELLYKGDVTWAPTLPLKIILSNGTIQTFTLAKTLEGTTWLVGTFVNMLISDLKAITLSIALNVYSLHVDQMPDYMMWKEYINLPGLPEVESIGIYKRPHGTWVMNQFDSNSLGLTYIEMRFGSDAGFEP